jgi:recombinational DNA repair protein (RecF pathway)
MNRGIVLRTYRTHETRLTIFDESQGKIIAYSRNHETAPRTPCGALLMYQYSLWRDMMFLEFVELQQLPFVNHDDNNCGLSLSFVHQILEILEAFMPISSPLPELFEKVNLLYTDQVQIITATVFRQQVFLCQILASLGVYPDENTYLRNHVVRCLILSPFEFMVDHEDTRVHDALKLWLKECLATHPTVSTWKTLN